MAQSDPNGDEEAVDRPRRGSGFWGVVRGMIAGVLLIGSGLIALNEFLPPPEKPAPTDTASEGAGEAPTGGETANEGTVSDGEAVPPAPAADGASPAEDEKTDSTRTAPADPATGGASADGTPGFGSEVAGSTETAVTTATDGSAVETPAEGDASAGAPTTEDPPAGESGTAAPASDAAKGPTPAETIDIPEIALAGPAIEVNARAFETPGNAGLVAVVLYGGTSDARLDEALSTISMPLTLAVRTDRPDLADFVQKTRQRGFEILAELALPTADSAGGPALSLLDGPARLEAGAAGTLASLSTAVGAVAPDGATLLDDREAMAALLKPVSAHGFVWVEPRASSRSAAARLAAESELIFLQANVHIGPGSSEADVYEGLQEAAGQARTLGTAIIFVEAGPDALRALVRWGLERVGSGAVLAPISAIVRKRGKR